MRTAGDRWQGGCRRRKDVEKQKRVAQASAEETGAVPSVISECAAKGQGRRDTRTHTEEIRVSEQAPPPARRSRHRPTRADTHSEPRPVSAGRAWVCPQGDRPAPVELCPRPRGTRPCWGPGLWPLNTQLQTPRHGHVPSACPQTCPPAAGDVPGHRSCQFGALAWGLGCGDYQSPQEAETHGVRPARGPCPGGRMGGLCWNPGLGL